MGYVGLYNRKPNENVYEAEKRRDEERKKKFEFVESFPTYDSYRHKKHGFRESFPNYYVSKR